MKTQFIIVFTFISMSCSAQLITIEKPLVYKTNIIAYKSYLNHKVYSSYDHSKLFNKRLKYKSLNDFAKSVETEHKIYADLGFDGNETRFNLDLLFDNIEEMFNQVEEQIGVRFVKEKRPTRVLKITKN